jgi:hypothetical protein
MAEQRDKTSEQGNGSIPARPGAGIGRGPEDSGEVGTPRGRARSGSGTHGRGPGQGRGGR